MKNPAMYRTQQGTQNSLESDQGQKLVIAQASPGRYKVMIRVVRVKLGFDLMDDLVQASSRVCSEDLDFHM